jgi:hypothetical protein
MSGLNFEAGSWSFGAYNSQEFNQWRDIARESEDMFKSMTTGEGIVSTGTGSGDALKPLRVQFLHGVLEQLSYEQNDAMLMKIIPKEKIYSNTFEWSTFNQYGGAGDGFTPETGTDGAYGVSAVDDTFSRQVANVKYMAAVRTISLVAQQVRNVEDAEKVAEKGATLEIIGKANLAGYYGDALTSSTQFNGLFAQIWNWVKANTTEQDIMYDAGHNPISREMIEDIMVVNRLRYGNGSLLLTGCQTYADMQKLLFPTIRVGDSDSAAIGLDKRQFRTPYGTIKLVDDPMLRPNRPLMAEGAGVTGRPKTSADTGSLAISTSSAAPLTCTAGPASTLEWYNGISTNSAAAGATYPALPTGRGNQGNRLAPGTYYYAISTVYQGKESLPWKVGATSAGIAQSSASAPAVTASNNVVKLNFHANGLIAGVTTLAIANQTKIRVYRCSTDSTNAEDWAFLFEAGLSSITIASAVIGYDNGMFVPGDSDALLITESKNGAKAWMMAQLLPLMRRQGLPEYVMGSPLAMLWFATPILLAPRHHIWIRNIARLY